MTPRERFDRLLQPDHAGRGIGDRGHGDDVLADGDLSAYGMLDTVDADARYHAGADQAAHRRRRRGARARATPSSPQPGHLFGYIVRGTVARFREGRRALEQGYTDFLAHYEPR